VTTAGSMQPKKRRRYLRAAINVAAATMITTGALLVGISVSQHRHHDHAVAAQAARKAQVDQAAVAEARQFQAETDLQAPRATTSTNAERRPQLETQQLRTAAFIPSTKQQKTAGTPARRPSPPARPRSPAAVTKPGAVSEVRGAGATLVIPALRVHAPVVATGAVDGSMTIPADIHTVGWYDGTDSSTGTKTSAPTPWPGQPGVSLLAGHVDWAGEGPGALYYLGQLVPGDPIQVIGSNRESTYWRVSQPPIVISKANLPANIFVNTGPPRLAIVTCGGPFDAATGHYLDNVVVWATLTTH
jgi:hypothetical protein